MYWGLRFALVYLSRSVELAVQWDRILVLGAFVSCYSG